MKALLFLLLNFTSLWASSFVALELEHHVQKKASEAISQVLPQGRFTVSTRVFVKKGAAKIFEKKQVDVRLPLSGRVISVEKNQDQNFSIDKFYPYIKSVEISVGIPEHTSRDVKKYLLSFIKHSVGFEKKRGDKITFHKLPRELAYSWNVEELPDFLKESPLLYYLQSKWGSKLANIFLILVGLIGLAVIVFWSVRAMKKVFEGIASTLSEKEGEVTFSSNVPASSQKIEPNNFNSSIAMNQLTGGQSLFDNAPIEVLKLFCIDCQYRRTYKVAPVMLCYKVLNEKKASELRKKLPEVYFEMDSSFEISEQELFHVFETYYYEYRQFNENELSRKLMYYKPEQVKSFLNEFFENGEIDEILVCLKNLLPQQKAEFLLLLNAKEKIQLFQRHTHQPMDKTKYQSIFGEVAISTPPMVHNLPTNHSVFAFIEKDLTPQSFEEDELFFENKIKGHRSILSLIDSFSQDDWARIPLKIVALGFFGYSDNVKDSVKLNYSEKRLEWLEESIHQALKLELNFLSYDVVEARNKLLEYVKKDEASNEEELPSLFNKAS